MEKHKKELEEKLARLEKAIETFSKKQVYVAIWRSKAIKNIKTLFRWCSVLQPQFIQADPDIAKHLLDRLKKYYNY